MIERVKGNILESEAECLVNPVNCVGVMGKGLALAFKIRYPWMFESYRDACSYGRLVPGHISWVVSQEEPLKYIFLFTTKNHWRDPSELEWIESGLSELPAMSEYHKIKSIAIPRLGCGLGGLEWDDVLPLIAKAADKMPDVRVEVYG